MPEANDVLAGRYELTEVISRGGMATVWRARDQVLARTVAVKCAATARRKLRNMATVSRVSEREAHVPQAFAFHGKIVEREHDQRGERQPDLLEIIRAL